MKNKNSATCEMCGVSSNEVPLTINPKYFIFETKIIELSHEGKLFCCDCLHDELVVIGEDEK